MVVDPTACNALKISEGSQKYRKVVDHRKGGLRSGAKSYEYSAILMKN